MADLFKDMGDFAMAKDYNGAERFNDGRRPLIAEMELADVIICGIPGKDAVSISVHSLDGMVSYTGEVPTKEAAVKIGEDICGYVNDHGEDMAIFSNGVFKNFFNRLPVSNIDIFGHVEDLSTPSERSAPKPPLRARIANVEDMAAMFGDIDRLRRGDYPGVWLDFPATKEAVQAALQEIGVDGITHKTCMAYVYKTEVAMLDERLPASTNIDELNYLAAKVDAMTGQEQEVFATVMYAGQHTGSVAEIINAAENISLFDVQPAYTVEDYGAFLADMHRDEFAEAMERLSMFSDPEMRSLAGYIERLEQHFDATSYAREVVAQEHGIFTDWGYVTEGSGFAEVYKGVVPPEYRVFAYPEPEERPSALGRLAAAKDAVARADAEKPPANRPEKSPGAEL